MKSHLNIWMHWRSASNNAENDVKGACAQARSTTQGECSTTPPRRATKLAWSSAWRAAIGSGFGLAAVVMQASVQAWCIAVHRIIKHVPSCSRQRMATLNSPLHPKALRYLAAVAQLGSVQAAARVERAGRRVIR